MPPIVASQEHVSAHPELHRTSGFTVLRAQYDRSNSNCGGADPPSHLPPPSSTPMDLPQHNKVVGGHLLLGKRSSTPAGHHYALTATVSLLGAQHSALLGGKVSPTSSSSSRSDSPAGMSILEQHVALGAGNFHRRLDRSHSEPVWQQQLQQQQQQLQDGRPGTNSSRYKTELCRPFEENGFCKYGDKCQFAHGGAELRTLNRHPKYKTELCRTFHTIGICPYGPRCHFIHNAEESRVSSPAMSALPMPGSFLSQFALGNQHHQHHNNHQITGSPPPALVPVSSSSPTNHHHHHPLTISPPPSSSSSTMGLPTIFDKNSPPSSISGGSPTSSNVFFDESTFPYFRPEFLDSFAESFSGMSLNNKATLQSSLNNQLNQINNHLNNNNNSNNLNSSFSSNMNENHNNLGLSHFNDLLSDSSMSSGSSNSSNPDTYSQGLSSIDTPPASPPDTSSNGSLEDTVSSINSMRLPIFQSINSVQ